jgi:hypothetical protein
LSQIEKEKLVVNDGFDQSPVAYQSYSWSQVFLLALTKPSLDTYTKLIRDPKASTNKAYLWLFIGGLVAYAISYLLTIVIGNPYLSRPFDLADTAPELAFSTFIFVCCAPILGILSVLGIALQAAITQFIARLMGGTGSYSQLLYGIASYSIPLSIITVIVSAFAARSPVATLCLSVPLSIFSLVLFVTAINAVNQFGWGKAIASGIIVPLVIAVLVTCGVIFILSLLGSQIGQVFSEIIRALETPVTTGA